MKINRMIKMVWIALRWILGAIGVALISAIITSAISGINLWNSLKLVVSKVCLILLSRDAILFLLVGTAFILIIALYRKVGRLSGSDLKEVLAKNEHLLRLSSQLQETVNPLVNTIRKLGAENQMLKEKAHVKEFELSDEHIIVLLELANARESRHDDDLFEIYHKKFPNRERKDFKFVMNDLTDNELIRIPYSGSEGIYYSIESYGLNMLRKKTSKV